MTRRSPAEEQVAYAAALASAPGRAAPVVAWSPPAGALAQVLIHLTPFAPGLDDHALGDDARWRWLAWVTPAQVIRRVLMRLARRADQVALRATTGADGVEILDRADPEGPTTAVQEERLLAIVFDVPAAALRLAWAALVPSAEVERHAAHGATVLTLKPRAAAQFGAA